LIFDRNLPTVKGRWPNKGSKDADFCLAYLKRKSK